MTGLMWPPAVIGGLTVTQLICLMHDRPPWRRRIASAEDYAAEVAAEAEAERAWHGLETG